jgi:hypothetical protein
MYGPDFAPKAAQKYFGEYHMGCVRIPGALFFLLRCPVLDTARQN